MNINMILLQVHTCIDMLQKYVFIVFFGLIRICLYTVKFDLQMTKLLKCQLIKSVHDELVKEWKF